MPTLGYQKQWKIQNPNPQLQFLFSNHFQLHPIIAQLLINRGILTIAMAESFLSPEIAKLHDPFLLKDMDIAIKRIRQAKVDNERVLIFGDYDVDGVTSSVIMHKALKKAGIQAINHIPHRMLDGYGLNENVVNLAKQAGASLVITVDCGITARREVDLLNAQGVDVIIFDHHEPSAEGIPQAHSVVNPKRKDCSYPFKDLASVGLMGKFTQAFWGALDEDDLDLIALGTIADVVPLRGENRIFVKSGLPKIETTKNKGLAALLDVAKIKGKAIRPYYVGFILGPRLNATGRMDSAKKSLDLLLSEDDVEAYALAQFLEETNSERQRFQKEVVEEAVRQVEEEVNFNDHKVIVLSKEGWHKGVLGIAASRVTEMYYRPTIIISLDSGVGTASARSIDGFHLHEALSHCASTLENFGGHRLAAGLTIRSENIGRFRDQINDFAKEVLQGRQLIPSLSIDCEISLNAIDLDLINAIDRLEPYGEGNPSAVFCSRGLSVRGKPAVLGKETLKFWVTDGQSVISAVGFGMAKYSDLVSAGEKLDLAFELAIDDWNKAPTAQLKIKDIKRSEAK